MINRNARAVPTPHRISAARKFIPNGDIDFVEMARRFSLVIAKDPPSLGVTRSDSDLLAAEVAEFGARLGETRNNSTRGPAATQRKEVARKKLEQTIRRLAHLIRACETLDPAAIALLKLPERKRKAAAVALPPEPPRLKFVRAIHESSGATPLHSKEG